LRERSDKEKRKEIERMKGEIASLSEEIGESRRKTDAAVARSRALERDNKDLKNKMSTLLNKLENDDKLIAALQDQKYKSSSNSKRSSVAMTPTTTTTADLLATIARLENQLRINAARAQANSTDNDAQWQARCEALEMELSGMRNIVAMLNKRMEESNRTALNSELNLVRVQEELARKRGKESRSGKPSEVPYAKLQIRLDVALNEIQVLKDTVKAISAGKEAELQTYWEMLDELRYKYEAALRKQA